MKKQIFIPITIVVILLTAGLGFFVFTNFSKIFNLPQAAKTATVQEVSPSQISLISPMPQIQNEWKTYKNEDLGFEIGYYGNGVLVEGLYLDGYEIRKEWFYPGTPIYHLPSDKYSGIYFQPYKDGSQNASGLIFVSVTAFENPKDMTLTEFFKGYRSEQEQTPSGDNPEDSTYSNLLANATETNLSGEKSKVLKNQPVSDVGNYRQDIYFIYAGPFIYKLALGYTAEVSLDETNKTFSYRMLPQTETEIEKIKQSFKIFDPKDFSAIKSFSLNKAGCIIDITSWDARDLSTKTTSVKPGYALYHNSSNPCFKNPETAKLTGSRRFLVFENLSGGIDSMLSVFSAKHNKVFTVDVYGTSTLFDFVPVGNDYLLVLTGYEDGNEVLTLYRIGRDIEGLSEGEYFKGQVVPVSIIKGARKINVKQGMYPMGSYGVQLLGEEGNSIGDPLTIDLTK